MEVTCANSKSIALINKSMVMNWQHIQLLSPMWLSSYAPHQLTVTTHTTVSLVVVGTHVCSPQVVTFYVGILKEFYMMSCDVQEFHMM